MFADISPDAIKTVPEIIRAASASALGIVALIVLALAVLAVVFFRSASQLIRVSMFVVLLAAVVGYSIAVARTDKSAVQHYVGRVTDKKTEAPIRAAKISLEIEGAPPVSYTDSEGTYSFWLRRLLPGLDGRIRVDAEGYDHFDRILSVESGNKLEDIRLQPIAKPIDVAQPPPQCGQVEQGSGPQISGVGKGWSGWYQVRVGPSPARCTVDKVEFWLTGDRQCNAWSECQELTRDDSGIAYQFRLQGHQERFPGQAYSEGHLRVIYKPK